MIKNQGLKKALGVQAESYPQLRWLPILLATHLAVAAASNVLAAAADNFPTRPIRLIVPYAPGGGADTLARVIGQSLSEALGYSVVTDNRGGGGTILGTDLAAKAAPDGHTIIVVASTHAVLSSLYKTLPFDPIKDFAPIIRVASAPNLLVLHPSVPAASVKELVALAKARPGQLVYASSGNGGGSHLAMELFKSIARIDLVHVPYKGTGPAMIDLLSGQTKLMFGGMIGTVTHVRSGRLRTIAVSSATRSATMPEVPTVAESGYPDYEATTWYGVLAPAGTPRGIVQKLNGHITAVVKDPKIQQRITSQGAEPASTTPEEFAAYIKSEETKWAKVLKGSGVRVD